MSLPIPSIWWAEERIVDMGSLGLDATLYGSPTPSTTQDTLTPRVKALVFDSSDTQSRSAPITGNVPSGGWSLAMYAVESTASAGYWWTIGWSNPTAWNGWRMVFDAGTGSINIGYHKGSSGSINGITTADGITPKGPQGYFAIVVVWDPDNDQLTLYWRDSAGALQVFVKTGLTTVPSYDTAGTFAAPGFHNQFASNYCDGAVADYRFWEDDLLTAEQAAEYLRKYTVADVETDFDRTFKSGRCLPVVGLEVLPKGAIPREDDLECWLRFHEQPGKKIRDHSGNARHATFQRGGTYLEAVDGWAAGWKSDGTDDYVDFGSWGIPSSGDDATLVFYGQLHSSTAGYLIAKHDSSLGPGGAEDMIALGRNGSGKATLTLHGNTLAGSTTIADDETVLIVGTVAPSGADSVLTLFVNGVQDGTTTVSSVLLSDQDTANGEEWTLACDWDGTGTARNEFVEATFAEAMVFSRDLDADEIEELKGVLMDHRYRSICHEARWKGLSPSLADLKPVGSDFDIESNRFTQGAVELHLLDDGWWTELVEDNDIASSLVRLWCCDERMDALTAGRPLFDGYVREWDGEDGLIKVQCEPGPAQRALETLVTGHWESLHPLEIFRDILDGIAADLYDEESTDPYQPGLIDISHFAMSRHGEIKFQSIGGGPMGGRLKGNPVDAGVSAKALIDDMVGVLPGAFVVDNASKWRFLRHDLGGAAQHAWTEDDIDMIRVESMVGNLRNAVLVDIGVGLDDTSFLRAPDRNLPNIAQPLNRVSFECTDADSISRNVRKVPKRVTTEWLSQVAHSDAELGGSDEIRLHIGLSPFFGGWSGCSLSTSQRVVNGTQDIWRQLDEDLERYQYILGHDVFADVTQIARVTAVQWDWDGFLVDQYDQIWPISGPDAGYGPTLSWDALGQFGSHASLVYPYTDRFVYDFTIPGYFAEYYLTRFADGCPVVLVETGLDKIDVELGDVVTIAYEPIVFARNGLAELSASTAWQVVAREVDILGDAPKIRFKLAWLNDTVGTPVNPVSVTIGTVLTPVTSNLETASSSGEQAHVQSGVGTSDSGLTATVEEGAIRRGSQITAIAADRDITLIASSDNYVYWDPIARELALIPTTVGAGQPTVSALWVPLYKYETDGSGVVGTTTLFSSTALDGSKLDAGSVDTTQLAADAVETAKIADDAVTQAKIADNAVGNPQLLDDAVDTDELVDEAVTAAKLAPDAVTADELAQRQQGTVSTGDATPTTIVTIPLTDDTEYVLRVFVAAQEDSQADGNAWTRHCWAYRRSGGGATIGLQSGEFEGQSNGWSVAFATSSNDLLVQVTGAAATNINWSAVADWEEVAG